MDCVDKFRFRNRPLFCKVSVCVGGGGEGGTVVWLCAFVLSVCLSVSVSLWLCVACLLLLLYPSCILTMSLRLSIN